MLHKHVNVFWNQAQCWELCDAEVLLIDFFRGSENEEQYGTDAGAGH